MGKVPTEMELVLEQTQHGSSYEVSVSAEGVEELKRKVKIKEHQSDTQVITVKMEILLEPTSNKLMVAGNPVKEILLKLNLPDHRLLKDGGEDFRYSDTVRLSGSDEVLKSMNFKEVFVTLMPNVFLEVTKY
ncbi:hypothetical protein Tco_0019001 [Tanacetum coccineum]